MVFFFFNERWEKVNDPNPGRVLCVDKVEFKNFHEVTVYNGYPSEVEIDSPCS